MVIGPTTGIVETRVTGLRINDLPAADEAAAKKGDEITFALPSRVRPGDKLYRVVPR